jgi:hypothetical protein
LYTAAVALHAAERILITYANSSPSA